MTMEFVSNYIDKKINENQNFIRFTFFELRITQNLSESEMALFISLAKQRLINNNYLVYKTGQRYKIGEETKTVKTNELLIAIKKGWEE